MALGAFLTNTTNIRNPDEKIATFSRIVIFESF